MTTTGIVIAVFVILVQVIGAILKQRAEKAEAERRRQAQAAGAAARAAGTSAPTATLDDGTGTRAPTARRLDAPGAPASGGLAATTRPAAPGARQVPQAPKPIASTTDMAGSRQRGAPVRPGGDATMKAGARMPPAPRPVTSAPGAGEAPRRQRADRPTAQKRTPAASPAGEQSRPVQPAPGGRRGGASELGGLHDAAYMAANPAQAASIESSAAAAMAIRRDRRIDQAPGTSPQMGQAARESRRTDSAQLALRKALQDPRTLRSAVLLAEVLGPPVAERRPSVGPAA